MASGPNFSDNKEQPGKQKHKQQKRDITISAL
jgi:hypothetical protein